jgi:uncharacterized protein YjbI with pentapeptide repeats
MNMGNRIITFKINYITFKIESNDINKYPKSKLCDVISKESDNKWTYNEYNIYCDPQIFEIILNSIKYDKIVLPNGFNKHDELQNEIIYYKLPFIVYKSDYTREQIIKILNENIDCEINGKLCGIDLSDLKFKPNLKINYINFNGSTLNNCIFLDNLTGCKFHDCDMNDVYFSNFNYNDNNFTNAKLNKSYFENANLIGSKFNNAIMKKCNFVNVMLDFCDFTNVDLTDSVFTNCSCNNTIFTNANFKSVIITNCKFKNAKLINTKNITW